MPDEAKTSVSSAVSVAFSTGLDGGPIVPEDGGGGADIAGGEVPLVRLPLAGLPVRGSCNVPKPGDE